MLGRVKIALLFGDLPKVLVCMLYLRLYVIDPGEC